MEHQGHEGHQTGMVAVVHGLQDSGLAVTLLDGGKRYTLMPNDHVPQPRPVQRCHQSVHCASQYTNDQCSGSTVARHCENGIQATDGRYASTYKMMHCNLTPTSPPQTVSEFPPQRSEVIHGHGNFVIGGTGSGETAPPVVKTNSFRGGMVWPDKGSVCASRASIQSDAFANSLRKYPNITPDRSSEIVQRLISFTQAKNLSKYQNRCPCSPTRNSMASESSKQTFILERNSSRNSGIANTIYQAEDNTTKNNRPGGNSPVRDRSNNFSIEGTDDSWNRPMFCKDNDVRCFRDTARKLKQGFNNLVPTSPHNKSPLRAREHDCEFYQRRMQPESKRSVNMEIQAGAEMETKEILTLPRIVPMQRTVATPLSPIPSKTEGRVEEELKSAMSSSTELLHDCSCKSVQVKLKMDDHIKITSSAFNLQKNNHGNKNSKRIRSEEELGKIKPNSILSFMQECKNNSDVNELFSKCPMSKKKRICQNCRHLFDDFDIVRRSVSNNTYFHEDFNINQQRTSKHFIEMSKHYYINGSDRVSRYNKNLKQHQSKIQQEYLSHIDSVEDNKRNDTSTENRNRYTKTINDSINDTYGCNNPDSIIKYVDGEKNAGDYAQVLGKDNINGSKNLSMTGEEIRNLIDLDILAFAEKYRINITTEMLYDLNEELFDLFLTDLNNNSFPNKQNMTVRIKNILRSRGLSELQTIYLTNILTEHWEDEFLPTKNLQLKSSNFQSETLVVLPNIIHNSPEYKQDENSANDNNEFSIKAISQKDIDTNVEVYVNRISHEINEWLSNLLTPEGKDEEIRLAIVNDLAADIVDRHKYLEINPSSETSETSELEHLKYQIFKLIYKFGINDMTLIDRAMDLMKRIRNVSVLVFSTHERQQRESDIRKVFSPRVEPGQSIQVKVSEPSNLGASTSKYLSSSNMCCDRPTCKRNLNKKGMSTTFSGRTISLTEPGRSYQPSTSTRRMSSPGKSASTNTDYNATGEITQPEAVEDNLPSKQYERPPYNVPFNRSTLFSGGIKIRDDEDDNTRNYTNTQVDTSEVEEIDKIYKQYLKEWVEKIPLPMVNAESQMVAEVARTDLYNGILGAVSKLRSERDTYDNRFLFEDKLDDEIEKLLSKLPQSPELSSKKHILKVKLIEQISDINDFMKSSTKSYKLQLLESVQGNLPKPTLSETENPDILEIYEELQILNLVEDFIICSHYRNQDPHAAEAYRKKLLKRTEDFVQELKVNHNKALKNIDTKLYINDILNLLKNVPLPSNETIQEEADEILLSIEIDKWFSELPLVQNNDYVEQLHRRKLRNYLAKQIIGIEKGNLGVGTLESSLNNSLKHEISQFLERAPLQHGESLNINTMVDELIKRLKNRQTIGNDNKKVAFNEPEYEEFSRNMPLCSTYTEQPHKKIETQMKGIPSTKSIQAIDPNQQSHSGYYHNISKPLFDDLRIDQTCCNDLSLRKVPDDEMFGDTQPRSSSLKDDVDPNWFTLQESRQGNQQSKISFDNNRNTNRPEQSNKSMQTISSSEQSQRRHYHNIAQPLLDDLRQDSSCCNNNLMNNDLHNGVHPRDRWSEPNWYSLHESKQNCSQSLNKPFLPYPDSTSQRLGGQERFNPVERHNMSEQDFNIPQQYLQHADSNHYEVQKRRDISYNNLSSKIMNDIKGSIPNENQYENVRGQFNNTVQHRGTYSQSPTGSSPGRRDSPRFKERRLSPRTDQGASPHATPYLPRSPKEANSKMSNRLGYQNIIEDQRDEGPQLNTSDVFYRSTDPDGIRRIIDRNKDREAEMDKNNHSNPREHIPEYYKPSVLIPPCYVPLRLGTKKGHMRHRNIDERYREDDSDEENDEEDEVRCRCVEKMWKSKRRVQYCPFEQYEGFPMCVTSPYFYPYYY